MASAREYELQDVPLEILDHILSSLPDLDLLITATKVSWQFKNSVQRIISRRRLDFSRCYSVREDELISLLKLCKDKVTSINIDHCYWLTAEVAKWIAKQSKLHELHMIECRGSSLLLKQNSIANLTSLSFSWDLSWLEMLQGDKIEPLSIRLFKNLKHLSVFVARDYPRNYFIDVSEFVLRRCVLLETLHLRDGSSGVQTMIMDQRKSRDHYRNITEEFLPNLINLRLDVFRGIFSIEYITSWLKFLFSKRTKLMNEIHLGNDSFTVFEFCQDVTPIICSSLSADHMTALCLDNPDNDGELVDLSSIPSIWQFMKTPKCTHVSLANIKFLQMREVSQLVADLGSQLQWLNLKNIHANVNDLLSGLATIGQHCTRLVSLDVTLHFELKSSDAQNKQMLQTLAEFKALKVLHISALTICSPDEEISEEAMKNSPLYQLTQSCTEIEELIISGSKLPTNIIISESTLACISKWRKLKTLHLVSISTFGRGNFLPIITRNCPELAHLYLAKLCRQTICNYLPALTECLQYTKSLKDLSIVQDVQLSSRLCKSLEQCQELERLFLSTLEIKCEEVPYFGVAVSKMPKLVAVFISAKFTSVSVTTMVKKMLKSLKSSRQPLTYAVIDSTKFNIADYPFIHLELRRYSQFKKGY